MSVTLAGKNAFITGGSRGIGKAICEALLQKKCKVCIADIDEPRGGKTKKEFQQAYGDDNVLFLKCDVTSENQFEDCLATSKEKFGNLDILINNAGVVQERDWEKSIDVNLISVIVGMILAQKHLSDSNGKNLGSVVNTAAHLALRTSPYLPAFCAAKSGVVAFSKCWGAEANVAKTGIKVNAVCPDIANTELAHSIPNKSIDKVQAKRAFEAIQSVMLTPDQIAEGFIRVLEDGVSGAVVTVTPEDGVQYIQDTAAESWIKPS